VLDRDPTAALAWLKQYRASAPDWDLARALAADAYARGVATDALPAHSAVEQVAVSADGSRIASAEVDGGIEVWTRGRAGVTRFVIHGPRASAVQFTPDGSRVVSAGADKHVRVSALDGTAVAAIEIAAPSRALAVFPDGRRVAIGLDDGTVVLWEIGATTARTLGHHDSGEVTGVSVSRDGATIASVGLDKAVKLWPIAGGDPRVIEATAALLDVELSPDGTLVAAIDEHGPHVWGLADGAARAPTSTFQSTIELAWVMGDQLAFGDANGDVWLWSLATGDIRELRAGTALVSSVSASRDGRVLATSSNRVVRVWTIDEGPTMLHLPVATAGVPRVSPDGKRVATGDYAGNVTVWEPDGGAVHTLHADVDWIRAIDWRPGTSRLCIATQAGVIEWNVATDATTTLWPARAQACRWVDADRMIAYTRPTVEVVDLASARSICSMPFRDGCCSRGDQLAYLDGDSIRLLSLSTCKTRTVFQNSGFVNGAIGSSIFAIGREDGVVESLDLATGARRALHGHDGSVYQVALSPDERRIASAGADTTIRVWDAETGALVRVHRIAFSPDGERIVSADRRGTIRLWSVTDDRVEVRHGHAGTIRDVQFGADGRDLYSSGIDGTVRRWHGTLQLTRPDAAWLDAVTTAVIDASGQPRSP
jgi:WD40 repeat protein